MSGRRWIVTTERATLGTGDYSLAGYAGRDGIIVERKSGLTELAGNLSTGRSRFEREMERMTAYAVRVLLVIGERGDIAKGLYRSKMTPISFQGSLDGWSERFNLTVRFVPDRTAAALYVVNALRRFLERAEREAGQFTAERATV